MLDDGNDPGIISVQLYASEEEYIHRTLSYYTDDVLTDERDIPINTPENFLPDYALTSFGVMSDDQDIVYIRNKSRMAMYEIVRLDKAYAAKTSGRVRKSAGKKEMGHVNEGDND